MSDFSRFDSISPIDYRYFDEEAARYLSENAFIRYKLAAEVALVKALRRFDLCPDWAVENVEKACSEVTAEEVYAEEKRIGHDVRALVNCIREKVSDATKPFVHMTATSYDIIDSANAARYRDVTRNVLVPALIELVRVLVNLAEREADTIQVGRTHGQHAVPITFGYVVAGYVSRVGKSVEALKALADELPGKFSGAVGAYNASSLFTEVPDTFEEVVLWNLGEDIPAGEASTQVVHPEALARLLCETGIVAGVMANLADDMRHLQRTEIGEVGEEFGADQVGSSTMPQKRNPINFENVKSLWKVVVPRLMTVFMDQISEHQRDLTNSASSRTYGEIIGYTVSMAKRLMRTMKKLSVDRENLKKNLATTQGLIIAEPLYLILASLGHPDAHEEVRKLTLRAQREKKPLEQIVLETPELGAYLDRMTHRQRQIIADPLLYTGISEKKAREIAERWKLNLNL